MAAIGCTHHITLATLTYVMLLALVFRRASPLGGCRHPSQSCYNANRSVWMFRASAPHSAIMRTASRIMGGGPHT